MARPRWFFWRGSEIGLATGAAADLGGAELDVYAARALIESFRGDSVAMAELRAGEETQTAEEGGYAAQWRSTLWAMVAVQFVMTMAFSMLTPIMPLLLPDLGVQTAAGIDIWAGILSGITSFVAAFASPVWGRVAARHGLKVTFVRFDSAAKMIPSLSSGEVDVGSGATSAGLYNAAERGLGLARKQAASLDVATRSLFGRLGGRFGGLLQSHLGSA